MQQLEFKEIYPTREQWKQQVRYLLDQELKKIRAAEHIPIEDIAGYDSIQVRWWVALRHAGNMMTLKTQEMAEMLLDGVPAIPTTVEGVIDELADDYWYEGESTPPTEVIDILTGRY
jgi:hypothetical protein